MNIIGQEKLCTWISRTNLDSFPRSLMLIGPSGAGKHLITQFIADHLNLSHIDITNKLDLSTINLMYEQVEPYIYVINANELTIKEENAILKILEEPLKNAYIILLAETQDGLLDTITNRCVVWHLNAYTKDQLKTFLTSENDQILEIALTPGDVIKLSSMTFNEMNDLAVKLITKIQTASISNTLSISDRINWKDDYTKLDYSLFIRTLLSQIRLFIIEQPAQQLLSLYRLTADLIKNSHIKNVDKRYLFEKYLIDARTLMKGDLL